MITRLLVANRGEIACRIVRTAHRLGIETVGVYSEPDSNALHVDTVDAAVALGGATPADSYLRTDLLIPAALAMRCDAIHPGYGFLAENADFARKVSDAGLIWVGPPAEQISLLGDKVAAKKAAADAGIPTVSVWETAAAVEAGDLPVLVKAVAGGGGRGMRIVRRGDELADAVQAASREAASAFGDGRVFIEPYIERGRHVEVQIIGDAHGNVVHLGERECSIQRRNQKIIEESPSAGIDTATRNMLCDGALALAGAVGYRNAGTVEFLVADDGTVNLLEVNTRLQVEHPVTEAVTGLDLVELQLLVAAGEPLSITQDDVAIGGHAIEARLVAEDPAAGWLPAAGRITDFTVDDQVRIDTGIRVGSVVSSDYDSLLAKIIAHAPTRREAARRLARSLRAVRVAGVATNRDTLASILTEPDFLAAKTPTVYLEEHPAVAASPQRAGDEHLALLLAAVVHRQRADRAADRLWGFVRTGWRNLPTVGHRSTWLDPPGNPHPVEEVWTSDTEATMAIGPWPQPDEDGALGPDERRRVRLRVLSADDTRVALEIDGVRRLVTAAGSGERGITVTGPWGSATWTLQPVFSYHSAEEAGSGPTSPLPGTVISVHVEAGQTVGEGDLLMVVEAMKMEHRITAARPGTVAEVRFTVGDRVDAGDLLVRLDSTG